MPKKTKQCYLCSKSIPSTHRSHARFCSNSCRLLCFKIKSGLITYNQLQNVLRKRSLYNTKGDLSTHVKYY